MTGKADTHPAIGLSSIDLDLSQDLLRCPYAISHEIAGSRP